MYGEKLISVEAPPSEDGTTSKIEYRVWNPFRSKLAAAILGGVDGIHIVPGAKVRRKVYEALEVFVNQVRDRVLLKQVVTSCGMQIPCD